MPAPTSMSKKGETKKDRFKRLAEYRTNEVLRKLKVLGNCSNRAAYEYSREDVEKIFRTIDMKVKEVRAKFSATSTDGEFKL